MNEEISDFIAIFDALPMVVKTTRLLRGLSIRAAAKEMGTDFSTLSRFESGKPVLSPFIRLTLKWLVKK